MKRKLLVLILGLCMILSLAGCASQSWIKAVNRNFAGKKTLTGSMESFYNISAGSRVLFIFEIP